MPTRGELKKNGEEVSFTPRKNSILDLSLSGPDIWIVSGGGVLISASLQDVKPHRPGEKIMVGDMGNYNIGLLAPCSGIPIFISTGNQRPKLVGISDANGHFAVKLPQYDKASEIFIFFYGEIEVLNIQIPDDPIKGVIYTDMNLLEANQNLVLKVGTSTVRYKVSIPKTEDGGGK
jgi:hypothetical protein